MATLSRGGGRAAASVLLEWPHDYLALVGAAASFFFIFFIF
jgi:hypothetical protein